MQIAKIYLVMFCDVNAMREKDTGNPTLILRQTIFFRNSFENLPVHLEIFEIFYFVQIIVNIYNK
jgi:hypothetical protein